MSAVQATVAVLPDHPPPGRRVLAAVSMNGPEIGLHQGALPQLTPTVYARS